MKINSRHSPGYLLCCLAACTTLVSCCPSGIFEDNFGSIYQLVTTTVPGSNPLDPALEVTGTVDTAAMGCGIWTVRNIRFAELPPDWRLYDLLIVAENPTPDAADTCCQAFSFKGNTQDGACVRIEGYYENIGTKCTQSGEMYLERSLP